MDDLEIVLRDLKDPSTIVRLRAARRVANVGTAAIISDLQHMRAHERDSWVRSALDSSIRTLTIGGAVADLGQGWVSPPADEVTEDIQALALQNAAQVIIHEVRQILRTLTGAASRDVPDFEGSGTAAELERLRSFLDVVERLQAAANPAQPREFDLRDLVLKTIRESGFDEKQVTIFRSEPFVVLGDPDLLELALRNLICNAVEASRATGRRVTVNFGRNDVNTWVVVLDEGSGLPGSHKKAWEPGVTSKSKLDGHFGWGLPIAQRAAHSFRGEISLTPRELGGVAAEISWPTSEGESS